MTWSVLFIAKIQLVIVIWVRVVHASTRITETIATYHALTVMVECVISQTDTVLQIARMDILDLNAMMRACTSAAKIVPRAMDRVSTANQENMGQIVAWTVHSIVHLTGGL